MLKNIINSLITKGTVAIINFLILIISSRYLGVSSRGEISIFILNLTIIQIINEVYTGYSLVYFIPKFNIRKVFISGIIYIFIFCSLSNIFIFFIGKQILGYEWLGYFISLLIIINSFNNVIILGKENVKTYNFLNLIQPIFLLIGILICILFLNLNNFKAYVYPLLFSFLITTIFSSKQSYFIINKKNNNLDFSLKPIIVNGLICQASILLYIFGNRYSYYLLTSNDKVGLYSSASSLIESVLVISNSFATVLLARVANQGNTAKSIETTLSLSKASLLLSSIAVLIIYLLPEQVFIFILGTEYTGVKNLMLLYSPGILMVSLFGIVSNYFSAIGKLKLVVICNSFGFVTTLILAPFLIKTYDMAGAAYSANIAYIITAMAICFAFFKINKIPFYRLFSIKKDVRGLREIFISEK